MRNHQLYHRERDGSADFVLNQRDFEQLRQNISALHGDALLKFSSARGHLYRLFEETFVPPLRIQLRDV